MESKVGISKADQQMSSQALVSVLMPAYNAEKFIAEAIQSILDQDYSDWELLILNDASNDDTSTIIHSFSDRRIKLFSNEKNEGYLRSCNRLFELAKGDFITFLDADDACPENRLSYCVVQFEQDQSLDFITTDHIRFDNSRNWIVHQPVDYSRYPNEPDYNPPVCCATIFTRSELLNKAKGYHPFFNKLGGEDYHWLYKISCFGRGMHVPEPLYNYRQHPHQTHMQYSDPLKYFVPDIIRQVRSADQNEKDLLGNTGALLAEWNLRLKNEPALLSLKKATEAMNHENVLDFWKCWRASIIEKPHSTKKLRQAFYLLYSYFARIA